MRSLEDSWEWLWDAKWSLTVLEILVAWARGWGTGIETSWCGRTCKTRFVTSIESIEIICEIWKKKYGNERHSSRKRHD